MNYTDQYSCFNIHRKAEISNSDLGRRLKLVFTHKFDFECLDPSILRASLGFFGKYLLQSKDGKEKKSDQNFLPAKNCRLRRCGRVPASSSRAL